MEKIGIIFMLFLSVISCSSDNSHATVISDYNGKWQLVQMSGSFINSETTGSAMEWQESYVFNTDGTFVKTRVADSKTVTASGTFKITKADDRTQFELTYKENSPIIGSCLGNPSESLFINEDSLLVSSWQACDGPGLQYKKMK
jgi:hypothetical protein